MSDNPSIDAVYYQPPSDGVQECVSIEVIGGPKRFARFWPSASEHVEWGWTLLQLREARGSSQTAHRAPSSASVAATSGCVLTGEAA